MRGEHSGFYLLIKNHNRMITMGMYGKTFNSNKVSVQSCYARYCAVNCSHTESLGFNNLTHIFYLLYSVKAILTNCTRHIAARAVYSL